MQATKLLEAIPLAEGRLSLRHWRWLVPENFQPLCVTQIGDIFLRDPHGSIWFLDVVGGSLELVAGNQDEWVRKLGKEDQVDQWSGRRLAQRLREAGLQLGESECYTYRQSPVLGGAYEPANFKVVRVQSHLDIWGPILEKVKDLPDGTKVRLVVKP